MTEVLDQARVVKDAHHTMRSDRICAFLAFVSLLILSVPSALSYSADTWGPGPGWALAWADEFDGLSLNTNNWTYDLGGGGWGNSELETYTKTNCYVTNGTLIITATQVGTNYFSSRIKTQGLQSWAYGKVAARIVLPQGRGMWPAFWMLGTNVARVSWPECGETDIMEMIGGNGTSNATAYGTLHWQSGTNHASSGGHYTLPGGASFYQDYHVFEVEWNPNRVVFRIDSTNAYWTVGVSNISAFQLPMFALLNLAVGGSWPGNPDASTVFPQSMIVDWVRAFQQTNPSVATIIMDNADTNGVTISGNWTTSASTPGYYGADYLNDGSNGVAGGRSVRFSPNLPATASYQVYLNWPAAANRASNTPVDVTCAWGVTNLIVNQQIDGNWVPLGTFNFNAGTNGNVLIRNDGANGYVVADAVRFVQSTAAPVLAGAHVVPTAPGQFQFTVVNGVGGAYQTNIIEATTNLADSASWIPIATNLASPNDLIFTDTNAARLWIRYYRLIFR